MALAKGIDAIEVARGIVGPDEVGPNDVAQA